MNRKRIMKRVGLLFIGSVLCLSPLKAEEAVNSEETVKNGLTQIEKDGMGLFEGSIGFKNGGPACITCHNVTNDNLIPGGLFAKDLTETIGATARAFAETVPNAPMAASYGNNPVTPEELDNLAAFFDYSSANKDSQTLNSGYSIFLYGGLIGLVCLFGIVQLLWMNRKKDQVKEDIFKRQKGSWDAKF